MLANNSIVPCDAGGAAGQQRAGAGRGLVQRAWLRAASPGDPAALAVHCSQTTKPAAATLQQLIALAMRATMHFIVRIRKLSV